MKRNKGQEEMVGFVLIIVLVAVIFLIFLGLFLRRGNQDLKTESSEVSQFLDSMLEYTTNCSLNSGFSYENIQNLATECDRNSLCSNGRNACDILKETSQKLIESSWNFAEESPTKGYRFSIKFEGVNTPRVSLDSGSGTCSALRGGSRSFQRAVFDLRVCLN